MAPLTGFGAPGSQAPRYLYLSASVALVGVQTSRAPNLGVDRQQQSGTLAALGRSNWLTISVCWIANFFGGGGVGDTVHCLAVYLLLACSLWDSSCTLFFYVVLYII